MFQLILLKTVTHHGFKYSNYRFDPDYFHKSKVCTGKHAYIPDPHGSASFSDAESASGSHQSGKLDLDLDQSGKLDPDPHQSEKLEALEYHFRALDEEW